MKTLGLLIALVFVPGALAATISGRVTDAASGLAIGGAKVSATRSIAAGNGGPDDAIAVDADATADTDGRYTLVLSDGLPGLDAVFVYTRDALHFNRLSGGIETSGYTPRRHDLSDPGARTIDARGNPTGVGFALESNRSDALVTMRDGVTRLATTIWRPARTGRWPVIMVRTPYNKESLVPDYPNLFVAADYAVVGQDTRGRNASEGHYTPFQDENWGERRDGFDTVEWIAAQDWSDGHVGSYGGSALGIVQYMTAGDPPSHLDAAWATVGTPALYRELVFQGGSYRTELVDNWLHAQNADYMMEEYRQHPNEDAYWLAQDLTTRLAFVTTPICHHGGWYDIFDAGTARAFGRLQSGAAEGARFNQKLRMGPWSHGTIGLNMVGQAMYPLNAIDATATTDALRWFDFWLKGRDTGIMDEPPVRTYVMGAQGLLSTAPGNTWRTSATWPPPGNAQRWYLHPGRGLGPAAPGSAGGFDTFTYDPATPVPTNGGPNLYLPAGPYDQAAIEARPDVISYTSAPLTAPIEVTGTIEAHLFASSDGLDTDWTVKLVDVYPAGLPLSVTDGVLRARHHLRYDGEDLLTPGQVYEFVVDAWTTSLVFDKGHRIRIEVSSSNSPRFDPNPNTGHAFRADGETRVATNTIWHTASRASYVTLPVVDGAAAAGCATSAKVTNLAVDRAAGGLRFRWNAVTGDACFGEYRLFGADDPRSWAWFVRHPLERTTATDVTRPGTYTFYLVIAAGTDGSNGPHWPTP